MNMNTNWLSGWTATECALTVAESHDSPETVEAVAPKAEVEVAVVDDVAATTEADLDD